MSLYDKDTLIALYDPERVARTILDLRRRIERLEEEMETARQLISETLKHHLNEERPQA